MKKVVLFGVPIALVMAGAIFVLLSRPAPAKHSFPAPILASVKFIEGRLAEPFLNALLRRLVALPPP